MKIVTLLLVITLFGCNQISPTAVDTVDNNKVIRENPYTVANMSKAAVMLGYEPLKATHLYVKTRGVVDTDLVTFYHPIEEEQPEGVVEYTGWTYTWFPIGRKVNFEYDVISEIVLQDDNHLSKSIDNYDEIEHESKKLTGDLPKNSKLNKSLAWNPWGTIVVQDDSTGLYHAIPGVTIKVTDWFKVWSGNTNDYGYFRCGNTSFSGKVRYWIVYNLSDWTVTLKNSASGQNPAEYKGPELNNRGWNHKFSATGYKEDWYDAAVFTGAAITYRQSKTAHSGMRISISALYKKTTGYYGLFSYSTFGAGIDMWSHASNGKSIGFLQLVGAVGHEMGHAMHWYMDKDTYSKANKNLQESYACLRSYDAVNYIKGGNWLNSRDTDRRMLEETNRIHEQLRTPEDGDHDGYLPIFVDLKDGLDQEPVYGYLCEDVVSGYNTLDIERIIYTYKCKSLQDFLNHSDDLDTEVWEYLRQYDGKGL